MVSAGAVVSERGEDIAAEMEEMVPDSKVSGRDDRRGVMACE